jgi:hypothetical protein
MGPASIGLMSSRSVENLNEIRLSIDNEAWMINETADNPLSFLRYSTPAPSTISRTPYSHSIVPGGFEVMSYTTRLTPLTSLTMRVATWPMNFMSKG